MRRHRAGLVTALVVLAACAETSSSPAVPLSTVTTSSVSESAPDSTPDSTTAPRSDSSSDTAPDSNVDVDEPQRPSISVIDPARVAIAATSSGWDQPVDLDAHPITGALYVTERSGTVRRMDAGPGSEPLIDLRDEISVGGERGLLGLAFTADGSQVWINLTATNGDTRILRLEIGSGPDPVAIDEPHVILEIDQPYSNHNGGEILIGPDGAVWVPTGDGGSGGDPQRLALDPDSVLGKLLRIDPTTAEPTLEIWASGLRNPWRASFDDVTGDLWIADVGQGDLEEISVARADQNWARGRHFGWSAFEGTARYHEDQNPEGHVPPVFEYRHGDEGCSISGGVRYRGSALGDLWGAYLFSDYCSGRVRALAVDEIGNVVGSPVDLGRVPAAVAIRADAAGEPWVVSIDGGLHALVPSSPS